jgi:hypothetical protein
MAASGVALRPYNEAPRTAWQGERGTANFFSSSERAYSSKADLSQHGHGREVLSVVARNHPIHRLMLAASIAFSARELVAAATFHDGMVAARDRWLLEKGRRLPHPDQLERERYGSQYRGSRHG